MPTEDNPLDAVDPGYVTDDPAAMMEDAFPTGWLSPADRASAAAALDNLSGKAAPDAPAQPAAPADGPDLGDMSDDYARRVGYGDVVGAQEAANTAQGNLGASETAQAKAELEAKASHENAKATAAEKYAADLTKANQDYETRREAAHKAAAAETAAWMQDLDHKAAEEPSPGRWWENTSNFGKAMWLASLAFGSAAVAHGAKSNVALDMMDEVIKEDIQSQKDRIARQMDTLRQRGQVMREDQKERLSDLTDDHTMAVSRYNAILQAAQARAEVTNSKDEASALAKVRTLMDTRKAAAATESLKERTQERLNTAQQGHATAMENLRFQHQKELKQMEEDAALAAKLLTAGGKGEGLPVAAATGISVVDRAGKVRQASFPKEAASVVQKISENVPLEAKTLREAEDALRHASRESLLLAKHGGDPELMSKIYSVLDPIIQQTAGMSGLSRQGAREAIAAQVFGVKDMFGLKEAIVENPNKIADVLKRRREDLQSVSEAKLNAILGADLGPNERIVYSIPDVGAATPSESTGADVKANMLATEPGSGQAAPESTTKVVHPRTADEVRERKATGDLPALPGELNSMVERRITGMDIVSPDTVKRAAKLALDDIAGWEARHLEGRSGEDAAGVRANAADARLRVDAAKQEAAKRVEVLDDVKRGLAASAYVDGDTHVTWKDAKEALKREGFKLEDSDVDALINEVNQKLVKLNAR